MAGGGRLVFGVSGVRGVVGEGLTPEVAARFASAMGTWCGGGCVVVGRDTRPSGETLRGSVLAGLLATGCDVVDVGICPTPTVQLAVREHGAAGGVVITASHNPGEYNGLKFVSPRGIFLTPEEGIQLREIAEGGAFRGERPGARVREDPQAPGKHLAKVLALSLLDVSRIRAREFRVVLDVGNGAGGAVGIPLLEALGCQARVLNAEPTGVFSRGPEPVPENLAELSREVVGGGADIGFALDPDGDRLSIVTEEGEAIGEEYSLALAADLVLSRAGGGTVVTNLSTSRMVEKVAERWSGRVLRTPVGEVHVSLRMMADHAVVGGEGNGGVILPEAHFGRDGAVGMALVLELLADRGITASAAARGLPRYWMIKRKTPVAEGLVGRLAEVLWPFVAGAEVETSDGIRAAWEDAWLHVRISGTEPVVRVVAEAEDRSRAEALVEEALRLVSQG